MLQIMFVPAQVHVDSGLFQELPDLINELGRALVFTVGVEWVVAEHNREGGALGG